MINNRKLERKTKTQVPVGMTVQFCRCWQSADFPYCDDTHKKINAETGDCLGPVVVTAIPAEPEPED